MDDAGAIERAQALAVGPQRRLLGLVGPPGAGKSTLAELLVHRVPSAVLVPMDGFHLADVQLRRLGRLERKGAPDTFDADGYVALLERLRRRSARPVYAPAFERDLEQPVAGSIAVTPHATLVVTEGNYLLLDDEPWSAVRPLLDEVWWVDSDPAVRRERLVARHVRSGKPAPDARDWVDHVDEVNAALVAAGRARADRIVTPW